MNLFYLGIFNPWDSLFHLFYSVGYTSLCSFYSFTQIFHVQSFLGLSIASFSVCKSWTIFLNFLQNPVWLFFLCFLEFLWVIYLFLPILSPFFKGFFHFILKVSILFMKLCSNPFLLFLVMLIKPAWSVI